MKISKFDSLSFEIGKNNRITKCGNLIRKYKIDELLQFVNVLIGNMSVVGPRPEVEKWTKVYSDKWEYIHTVKPGITDLASIQYRNEHELLSKSNNPEKFYEEVILPNKLKLYKIYVDQKCLYLDMKIILATMKVIFR